MMAGDERNAVMAAEVEQSIVMAENFRTNPSNFIHFMTYLFLLGTAQPREVWSRWRRPRKVTLGRQRPAQYSYGGEGDTGYGDGGGGRANYGHDGNYRAE